ncbi:hypothetical protein D3C81_1944010 [compost metagenome]
MPRGAGDDDAALVINLHLLIVQHMLRPVTLGAQIDFLSAFLILDAQFVVAATAGAALTTKNATGLVRRKIQRDRRRGVGQAAHDQRFVGVGIDETDQHFHADSRDQHAAVTVVRPVSSNA